MKRNIIIFTLIAALLPLSILTAQEQTEQPEQVTQNVETKNIREYTSSGRLIYIGADYFEIKQGRTELLFYFNEGTVYVTKNGEEKGRDAIEVCQNVRVKYTVKNAKNILTRVIVLKESNCVK